MWRIRRQVRRGFRVEGPTQWRYYHPVPALREMVRRRVRLLPWDWWPSRQVAGDE